jgi:hypothetical protein
MKKQTGYIRLYRYEFLIRLKHLTDPQQRLFLTYINIADWDRKNPETFGMVRNISIRKLKKLHLPTWSPTKIWETHTSLVKMNYLKIKEDGDIWIDCFWIYQATVPQAERAFRCAEQGIHPSEQNVRQTEQRQVEELQQGVGKLVEKFNPFDKTVRPSEQDESG